MPIGIDYFQPLSFQQNNPVLSGMSMANQIAQGMLQNQILAPQAQYAQPNAQVDLLQKMQDLPYTPYRYISPFMGNQARLLGAANNTQNSMVRYLTTDPVGMAYAAQHPEALAAANAGAQQQGGLIDNGLITAAGRGGVAGMGMPAPIDPTAAINRLAGMGVDVSNLQKMFPSAQPSPMSTGANIPMGNASTQASPAPQVPTPPQGNVNGPRPPMQLIGPSQALALSNAGIATTQPSASQQQVLNDRLTATQYTPQQIQQMTYDNSAQNMLAQVAPNIQAITQYSGTLGRGQLLSDKLQASFGQNSPQYQAYNNFTRAQAPLIVNEIRRAFGGQATEGERNVMDSLVNPNYWDSNPQLATAQLQALANSLHANTAAISQSKSQNVNQAQQSLTQPNAFGGQSTQSSPQPPMNKSIGGKTYTKINGQWYQQ